MSKQILQTNRPQVYKQIEKELGKTQADIDNDIKIIKEWLKTQPHLPEIPEDRIIESFILFNKFSIERTKQKLDMYYTIRSAIPELFDKHPCSPEMIQQAKVCLIVPLPKLANDQRRVIYSKFSQDFGPEAFNQDNYLAQNYNIMELILRGELYLGVHYIFDCAGFKFGHVTKISPMALKKNSVGMEKVFSNRVTSIHFINFHPYMETPLNFLKAVLPEKIRNRIQMYGDSAGLFNVFPKNILPKDVGGEEESVETLAELWQKEFQNNKALFDKLTTMRVDESKRPTKLTNDDILGFYGNFKKLDVD
ncbi:retinol-binding protein pinta-like [Euwallacea fornicatus]|uniref:retinol-binding protein pinta-like n=1 Tax=Euwallacea fornicatus TaxID=995702 RepID=UPI00338F5BFC